MDAKQRNALPAGDRLQNYQIEDVLGSGGFGITYVAVEDVTERKVAIKEFLPTNIAIRDRDSRSVHPISETDRADYEWGLDRFRQEAKVLITLEHKNIVPVLNYFEANGTGYLVMAYQDGKSLGALLRPDKRLSQAELDDIVGPIVSAIGAIHAAGFLHRDIKPDNIFIRNDGVPIVIDFGSARLALGQQTKSLTAIVSEGYAPFEQYQTDGHQGAWSDFYGLGATLYRCVTGRRPTESPARVAAAVKGGDDPLEPATKAAGDGYDPALLAAIDRALSMDETARPQSADDFLTLLAGPAARPEETLVPAPAAPAPDETMLAGAAATIETPGGAQGGPTRPSATSGARKRPTRWAWAAVAAGILVAGGASAYVAIDRPWETGAPGVTAQDASLIEEQKAEEARKKAEEDAKRKAEEEAARKQAEEAQARRKAEEDAKRNAEEEAKRKAETETRRKAEVERQQADAETRRRAEAERLRREREEADKLRRERESKLREEIERRRAAARRQAEERRQEELRRQREDAAAKRQAQQDRGAAEAQRKALEEQRRRIEERRKRQRAARSTTGIAGYLPGKRLIYRIQTGHGQEQYDITIRFAAGGQMQMSCIYQNFRAILQNCRGYSEGAGRWSIAGSSLCLSMGSARDCFTIVRRGQGYALGPQRRGATVRAFR